MPLLQPLVPHASKQGIKSKAGAIVLEKKITSLPNKFSNIPYCSLIQGQFKDLKSQTYFIVCLPGE